MTAKEYCLKNPAVAYASMLAGVEIHGVEYGVNDYILCVSGAWCSKKSYHRVKLYMTRDGRSFFMLHGVRVHLDECIRMGG